MKITVFLLFVFVTFFASCKKDEPENTNHKPVADFSVTDNIDYFRLQSMCSDEDFLDTLKYSWTSYCDSIKLKVSNNSSTEFVVPALAESKSFKVKLCVNDGKVSDSVIKEIVIPAFTEIRRFGLGVDLISEKSNDVNYSWYLDQMNTGKYSSINCGPTSVTMAVKWAKPEFSKTPEDARNTYRSSGGWWYTDDIINYLNLYSVKNRTIFFDGSSLCIELDMGNIAILCIDVYYLRFEQKSKWHVDKFYPVNTKKSGHFIVVKGYKVIDNNTFFEVYDPNSCGTKYADGSLKGINRYYRAADIDSATTNWWKYAIIVSKNKLKSSESCVDVSKIIHMPGM